MFEVAVGPPVIALKIKPGRLLIPALVRHPFPLDVLKTFALAGLAFVLQRTFERQSRRLLHFRSCLRLPVDVCSWNGVSVDCLRMLHLVAAALGVQIVKAVARVGLLGCGIDGHGRVAHFVIDFGSDAFFNRRQLQLFSY